ncbi:urea ABC transporter, permease protein UrtB [Haloterrigena turkmenica DSM 5511]|uniref:Urea ABC transporter, permease protein UrtB n=1 Tax=Haloterrigena turkmenica (strain ATCC 51198 / DSM 5511 / JCM 9101 / NCIMB 13204 / VKM B-1734 / 4k) TaxID=543526 RepID=D2RQW6_HALTV|nr:urea ABC transporter, permease protein UrtB [Haloterrigena turkmenica]ADB60447.1 urea ABC transporter, permease protein UrtB [Haloterrigena turkmenica DSM 5511]
MATPELLNLGFEFVEIFAFIVLATVGLAVIFGMMGIINLAHGEFILVGAYATSFAVAAGLPLAVAMAVGVVATAAFGLVLERLIIRRLYGRLLDSMVVTWGISLVMIQLTRIAFGNTAPGVGIPFGQLPVVDGPVYYLVLAVVAVGVLGGLYALFTWTDFGVRARATMQDEETARSMGVDTDQMYMSTFAIGSGLAGLAGALYAPVMTVTPEYGTSFLVESFVAVVVGGSSVLLGTILASGFLGTVNAAFTNIAGTFMGQVAMLVAAIVAIRLMPDGITGLLSDLREKWGESE